MIEPQPAIGVVRGAAKRRVRLAAHQQRRPGLLHRLRLEGDRRKLEEAAAMLDDRLAPQPLADRERLRETPAARGEGEPPRAPRARQATRPDPALRAAAPMPTAARPPETRSRVWIARADTNGCRSPSR